MGIDSDVDRFKNIIRKKVKSDLDKYISSDHILGQHGAKIVKIPIQRIDLPRFSFGGMAGGASSGPGEIGDGIGDLKKGSGNKPGEESAEHAYEAEFTAEDLANILGEHLELPNIENKGKGKINSIVNKYNKIQNNGPEGLKHFKRTYKEALKRSISSGTYDPSNPSIIPIKNDKRYRSASYKEIPECDAVIIYMLDISGSMQEEEKHIAKTMAFWIDLWLKNQYKNLESRFIIHDYDAREVDRGEFFTISESGGTKISSAFELCSQIMQEDYPIDSVNVYIYYFGDSDNLSYDNEIACNVLREKLVPNCNIFSYGKVCDGDGDFLKVLEKNFKDEEKVALYEIKTRADILSALRRFLGPGK